MQSMSADSGAGTNTGASSGQSCRSTGISLQTHAHSHARMALLVPRFAAPLSLLALAGEVAFTGAGLHVQRLAAGAVVAAAELVAGRGPQHLRHDGLQQPGEDDDEDDREDADDQHVGEVGSSTLGWRSVAVHDVLV